VINIIGISFVTISRGVGKGQVTRVFELNKKILSLFTKEWSKDETNVTKKD